MADGQSVERLILVCGATGNQGVLWHEAFSIEAFAFAGSPTTQRSQKHRS